MLAAKRKRISSQNRSRKQITRAGLGFLRPYALRSLPYAGAQRLHCADGKGWVVLTYDTTPSYLDTTPFPAALTKWKYRAIYRVDDHQVGQWSAEVSVNVGG